MTVTVSILLDFLAEFGPSVFCGDPMTAVFHSVRLFCAYSPSYEEDTLYVSTQQELEDFFSLKDSESLPDINLLCVADESWLPLVSPQSLLILVPNIRPFSLIYNRVEDCFRQMLNWELALDRVIYTAGTLQDMMDLGETMFRDPLLAWDATFNILAHSRQREINDPILREMVNQRFFTNNVLEKILSRGLLASRRHIGSLRFIDGNILGTHDCYIRHFFSGNARSCSVALVALSASPTQCELDKLQFFSDQIEQYLASQIAQDKNYHYPYELFLQELLDGKITDPGEIAKRATAFEIPFQRDYLFYVISFEQFSRSQADFLIYSMRQTLPDERFIIFGKCVCLLKATDAFSCDKEGHIQRFSQLFTTYHAYSGLSRTFPSLAECRNAYLQACAALRLGMRLSSGSGRDRIFFYKDYAIYHMLDLCSREIDLFSVLPHRMLRFYMADLKNGGSDLELLRLFMESGRSTSATAQAAFLHRNSVAYRIKRIEEHLSLNLSNMDSLLNVLLLLKIIRYTESRNAEIALEDCSAPCDS